MNIEIASPEDAAALLEIYAPYILKTAVTFEYEVPSVAAFQKRIEETLKKYPYLTAKKDGRLIGYAYAGTFIGRSACDWSVETSVYIQEGERKTGAGKKLLQTLEAILKRQNIVNVNAAVACPIEGESEVLTFDSVRFHEKMGYRLAGRFDHCGYKFGQWVDLLWMEKHIGEHAAVMPPFVPFPKIRKTLPKSLTLYPLE